MPAVETGKKAAAGGFQHWCVRSSVRLALQDKGCIALSSSYVALPLLTVPSQWGSATFVPHVTGVLAAQNVAVDTESSFQWGVRDMG